VTKPVSKNLVVQRFVDRRHFYSACSVTASFVAGFGGDEELGTKHGTAFMVRRDNALYFVTNRHVLDYNFKQRKDQVIPSATLSSIQIRGHGQPTELSEPTVTWSYSHGASGIVRHRDASTDLAVIIVQADSFDPPLAEIGPALNVYNSDWLAEESEIDLLMPGEEVFIVGYPGISGPSERPVLVTGIISSDPRYPAVFGNAELGNAVLCQSFSWQGMSGAPVLGFSESIGKTKIIGINAGHIAGSGVSGGTISHFVRSSEVIEILRPLNVLHDSIDSLRRLVELLVAAWPAPE
jgi:S1-C subfamily serine protease